METEQLLELQKRMSRENAIALTDVLTDQQIIMIGTFVQFYNFIELNVRRCIEVLEAAKLYRPGKSTQTAGTLHSSELMETLSKAVSEMDPTVEDIPDTLAKLTEIEFRRAYRHMYAHMAARNYQNECIVFFTRSDKDARRALAAPLNNESLMFAILPHSSIISLNDHVRPYERWIAGKVSEWEQRYRTK